MLVFRPILAALFVLALSLAGPFHGSGSSLEGTAVAEIEHGAGHDHAHRAAVRTDHQTDRTDDRECKGGHCAGCVMHCSLMALVDIAAALSFERTAKTFSILSESSSIGMATTVERPPESI